MRPHLLFVLPILAALLLPARASAQQKVFNAVVLDSLDGSAIEKCTVVFLPRQGKPHTAFTDAKGRISFTTQSDSLTIGLQHVGYNEKKGSFLLSSKGRTDTVRLSPLNQVMEGVTVKAKVPPIVVRDDTTEYNIDSTMFEPFDVVDDLLRRLPGLERDEQGRLLFHGKPITRILVDGEELFGGDPNFSLKKLPAGMVAKIQVMDTKTLEQLFNKTAPDGEDKTLNIKLKAGNKTFGNVDAGAGTKNQLDVNATLSRFNEENQLNLFSSYSSSNKARLGKAVQGPSNSDANGGINYNAHFLGAKRFGGNYNYNQGSNRNEMLRERTQVLTADTALATRSRNLSDFRNTGHQGNIGGYWLLDSSLILDISFSASRGSSNGESIASSLTTENGALRNESNSVSSSRSESQAGGATFRLMKGFNKKGRTLTVNGRATVSDQSSTTLNQSVNTYFKGGLPVSGDTLNRETKTVGTTRLYYAGFGYYEPITEKLRLNINGSLDLNRQRTERSQYNFDTLTHTSVLDSVYSADIASTTSTQNLGASLLYTQRKWNLNAGLTTVWQQSLRTLENDVVRQRLARYSPSVSALVNLAKDKSLRVAFSANTQQPTIEQLQPVPDNSNPLYVRLGNPSLRTAFAQNYNVSYNYNSAKGNASASLGYAPVSNQIVNAVTYDEFRRMTSQYINVNGVYTLRGNVAFSKYLRKGQRFTSFSASSSAALSQQVYFQAAGRYTLQNRSVNASLSVSRRAQAVRAPGWGLSFAPSYSVSRTPADLRVQNTERLALAPGLEGSCAIGKRVFATVTYRYSYNRLDYHSTARRNDEYSQHQFANTLRFDFFKKWFVQSSFTYRYNSQVPDGAPKAQVSSNLSATAPLWKGRGQLTLTAYDPFATAATLYRTVGENYTEDMQTAVLRNYFTVRLQCSFSKLEKKESKASVPGKN